jgi:release factor glutamine methyltransferase
MSSETYRGQTNSILQTYERGRKLLEQAGVPEAENSARYLVCHAAEIGFKFSDFQRSQQTRLTQRQLLNFDSYIERRAGREPVQYIVGNWDFYGHNFACKSPILIPRPETEELVELVLNESPLRQLESAHILDIGTGTGAIGISLLHALRRARCTAIDINPDAVALARENSRAILGISQDHRFVTNCSSFAEFIAQKENHAQFDIIVSNPPYIPISDLSTLEPEVIQFEDRRALDGGHDGLQLIVDIIQHAPSLLKSVDITGVDRTLWM